MGVWISGSHYQFEVVVGGQMITDVKQSEEFPYQKVSFKEKKSCLTKNSISFPIFLFTKRHNRSFFIHYVGVGVGGCEGGGCGGGGWGGGGLVWECGVGVEDVCQVLFLIYMSWSSVEPLPTGAFCSRSTYRASK